MSKNKNKLVVIIILIVLLFTPKVYKKLTTEELSYNSFIKMIEKKQVKEVRFNKNNYTFLAISKDGNKYSIPNPETEDFKELMLKKDINVKNDNNILSLIIPLLPTILIVGILLLGLKNAVPTITIENVKKENAKTKLKDVVLPKETIEDISVVIDYMNNKKAYQDRGIDIPNGLLLYGPPGTGKTLIAKAIAGETNSSFYATSGSDFIEMYSGRGAARVRELFKEAKENAPSIIFIDEIDAIGGKRESDNNSERVQTINALLNELDGFDGRDNVLVIAATNQIEMLDKALIRAGRFGKHIAVPLPMSKEERLKIINIHKEGKKYAEDVDFSKFSKMTSGLSGAEIASIMNEAQLIAMKIDKPCADEECLNKAFHQFVLKGHAKDITGEQDKKEKHMVAVHESGHAIISRIVCNHSVPLVSIIPTTSGAGGYTISLSDDISFYSKAMLEAEVKKLYAGRAAEMIMGYPLSTGASNDIEKATEILKDMKFKFGMIEENNTALNYEVLFNRKIPKEMFEEIHDLSNKLFNEVKEELENNKDILLKIVEELLANDTIDERKLDEIIERVENERE